MGDKYQKIIYLSSLLHDIGKFAQRSGYTPEESNQNYFKGKSRNHSSFSDIFLKENNLIIDGISDDDFKSINKLVSSHHDEVRKLSKIEQNEQMFCDEISESMMQRIIVFSDWLSAAIDRRRDSKYKNVYTTPLKSVFNFLYIEGNSNKRFLYEEGKEYYYHPLDECGIDFSNLRTDKMKNKHSDKHSINKEKYSRMLEIMRSELKFVKNESQLYYLMKKYTTLIPANVFLTVPIISLFDHSRVSAAFANILYKEWQVEKVNNNFELLGLSPRDFVRNNNDKPFMLIGCDIKGIQEFILSSEAVNTRAGNRLDKVSITKSLKGRSLYVNILLEIIAIKLIDDLKLNEANIIYSGGGRFYILAHDNQRNQFNEIKSQVQNEIFLKHKEKLYVTLEEISFSPSEIIDFRTCLDKVNDLLFKAKFQKFKNDSNKLTELFTYKIDHKKVCLSCSKSFISNLETEVCDECKLYQNLSEKVVKSDIFEISKSVSTNSLIKIFDYNINFKSAYNRSIVNHCKSREYKINEMLFLNKSRESSYDGFTHGAYNLPLTEGLTIKSFDQLVNDKHTDFRKIKSEYKKLAVLKLDFDNLGDIFSRQLSKEIMIDEKVNDCVKLYSPSSVASISRWISGFFEGVIPSIASSEKYRDSIYLVYSGGDDTLLVGKWDSVLSIYNDIEKAFNSFFNNPKLHFSAAIGIFNPKKPIKYIVQEVSNSLEYSKCYDGLNNNKKNKIIIFDKVFSKEKKDYGFIGTNLSEFDLVIDIKKDLLTISKKIDNTNDNKAIINKIKNICLLEEINDYDEIGKHYIIMSRNLHYIMREYKDKVDESRSNSLLNKLENIYLLILSDFKVHKNLINSLYVASRLAEYELRS